MRGNEMNTLVENEPATVASQPRKRHSWESLRTYSRDPCRMSKCRACGLLRYEDFLEPHFYVMPGRPERSWRFAPTCPPEHTGG
jgi:hypothetical protein